MWPCMPAFPRPIQSWSLLDRRLGFDWWAFIAVIDRHAALALVLQQAYQSFSLQLLGLPMLLGSSARRPGLIAW